MHSCISSASSNDNVCINVHINAKWTPYKGSNVNFALDAQRELDHQDVLKAFRSGANITSVIPRMSLIATLNEMFMQKFCTVCSIWWWPI
jgi:hypothetical protein